MKNAFKGFISRFEEPWKDHELKEKKLLKSYDIKVAYKKALEYSF